MTDALAIRPFAGPAEEFRHHPHRSQTTNADRHEWITMFDVSYGPRDALLFCVARFMPGDERRIRDVIIPFESQAAAALHAIERGWPSEGFQVAPLRFLVEELPVTPPAGCRMHLDGAFGRTHGRRVGGTAGRGRMDGSRWAR